MSLRLLYLIMIRVFGWLVLLGRRAARLSAGHAGHAANVAPSADDVQVDVPEPGPVGRGPARTLQRGRYRRALLGQAQAVPRRRDPLRVSHPEAGDAHPVTDSVAASMGWRGPMRKPPPAAGTNKTRPPSIASRTAENRPSRIRGMHQSGEQSRGPRNGTKRARIGKASGSTDRLLCPDAVIYMSVTTATHRPAVTHPDTWRDKKKTARRAAFPQRAGRFRRWWQVLGSNQRRLSRRFYSRTDRGMVAFA